MGVIFTEPKYPVVNKAPAFWETGKEGRRRVSSFFSLRFSLPSKSLLLRLTSFFSSSFSPPSSVSNFNPRDLGTIAGASVLSAPVGHLIGEREKERERVEEEESRDQ